MAAVGAWYLAISSLLFVGTWSLPVSLNSSIPGPFTGYQVLEVLLPETLAMGSFLKDIEATYQIDVWGRPSNRSVDIMVNPDQLSDVQEFIVKRQASSKVKVHDVQRLLDEHMDHLEHHRERRDVTLSSVTRRYLKFGQIREFLQNVRDNATNADVTLSSIGRTFEQRVTPYVTIRERNSGAVDKQVVVIEAGIHAREWIAPAMALNIIYRLAFNPNDESDINELLRKFDWVVIPVLNPDGYVHSHRNSSTRLWRKTRTTLYSADPHCMGVDGNRNFGFEWSDSPYKGGNSNPCTDNYSGPQGFSEPETRNLKSLLTGLGTRVALYLSLHSYGQFFLYPWGYDASATLEDEPDMISVGRRFADAMWERNRWYDVGSSAKVLYAAAGASDDYARGGAGVKYSFTVELSPTDSSPHGFLLPAHHISTVVSDHWPAFKAIALQVWQNLNLTSDVDTNNNHNNNNNVNDNNDQENDLNSINTINNNNNNNNQNTASTTDETFNTQTYSGLSTSARRQQRRSSLGRDGYSRGVREDRRGRGREEGRRERGRGGGDGRRERRRDDRRGRGGRDNANGGRLVEISIDGNVFQLDPDNEANLQWLQDYIHYLNNWGNNYGSMKTQR